ncbi:MAG: hypothetical protein KDC98_00400, partial [Planctomycetes bacterium]|nr:hypothetical protein [Planctomycetota bacterium]
WVVRWHGATGTPRDLYGQGLALPDWRGNTIDEARRQADLALRRWPELLGLGSSDFVESIGARMGRTWTFTFAQSFHELPVIGGRADVRIHMTGRLSYLGSTAFDVPATFDTTPTLGEDAATAIAWQSLELVPPMTPQPGTPRRPRLVIWGDSAANTLTPVYLAWEIPISAVDQNGDGPVGRAYIDAHSGARLDYRNDKHECGIPGCTGSDRAASTPPPTSPPPATYTVMGWLHTGYSPATTPTNEPLVGVKVSVPGYGIFYTDQNGQFSVSLTAPTPVLIPFEGVHTRRILGSDALVGSATLQPGQNQTIQIAAINSTQNELAHSTCYYWVHQINELARSLLGNSPQLAIADQVQPTVNINASCNAYYVGNSINFYHAAGSCNNTASASVVSHEWGHGLDDRYGGISQTNGLSEGWGDICSLYLLDDPVIGQGFYTNGSGIRNGNNTRQYPTGNGPHAQGQSWMGFAWKFRQNLRSQFGTAQAIAISNDVVLASIAADAEDQPGAVLQAFIADDDDGNLTNGTPHYSQLVAACNAHSLPYPQLRDGYLADPTVLQATRDQLVPRFVEIDAVPNTGAFAQVRLHYDDGQPRVRLMSPTTTPDRYRALLPGMAAPQPMSYHFEAAHGSGQQFRMPASGEYTYATLADEVFWTEDFESGGVGWTHGSYHGTDDWEIATPNGASGWGWTDPTAAASGNFCAGTDLTGNGAYSPSSYSWLRSPPIDCTGKTNVWMRCKRWASCESSSADQLSVRVNGVMIYQSYYVIQESGWTTFMLYLSGANNNPSVVIEFDLNSDAQVEMGGWQIDDLEIYSTTGAVPLSTSMTLLPEQATQGSPLTLSITTAGPQPFMWALGSQAGPTLINGVPPILVGGNYVTFIGFTDPAGHYTLPFSAPGSVPLTGTVWYSQALTINAGSQFETSNQFINLFTR